MTDTKSSVVLDRDLDTEKSQGLSDPRIRCPFCGWSPRKEDRWSCDCGHEWNTFDTGGVCPPAFTSGLRPSASRAVDGRRTPIGMRSDLMAAWHSSVRFQAGSLW